MDFGRAPGGYRILNLGDTTLTTAATEMEGVYKYANTIGYDVPIVCYTGNTCRMGYRKPNLAGMIQIYLYNFGTLNISTLDDVNIVPGSTPLPQPSTADNGKIIKVVGGKYTLATP